MKFNLEKITLSICENLPLNLTIYEERGCCKKKNKDCKYYKIRTEFCEKQTYTPLFNSNHYQV